MIITSEWLPMLQQEPVPDADDAELKLFLESRKHLPKRYLIERWENRRGLTRKVVYVNRAAGSGIQRRIKTHMSQISTNPSASIRRRPPKKNAFTGKSVRLCNIHPCFDNNRKSPRVGTKTVIHLSTYSERHPAPNKDCS
jgi:hypothetical protein